MKRFAILALLLPTAAAAEPAPWSGAYIAALGGNVFGRSSGPLSHSDPLNPGQPPPADAASISLSGNTGALAIGYNWQSSMAVYGVEADMAWMDAEGSGTISGNGQTWRLRDKLYSLGTVRGRLGFAAGPVLLYGTAGFAWGLGSTTNHTPSADGTGKASHLGAIGGGGVEWLVTEHVVLRGEYLAVGLGAGRHDIKGTTTDAVHAPHFVYDWDAADPKPQLQMWRIGVALKFN